jgi:hypothetical protein
MATSDFDLFEKIRSGMIDFGGKAQNAAMAAVVRAVVEGSVQVSEDGDAESLATFYSDTNSALRQFVYGLATLDLSGNAAATETITIGTDVYEFLAGGATVAADTNIAVEIGAAAATFANFIAAINQTAAAAHASILTTGPPVGAAIGRGTMLVYAFDLGSQVLGLAYTTALGTNPATLEYPDLVGEADAIPSLPLTNTLAVAASAWSDTNLNVVPWYNPAEDNMCVARAVHTVTAEEATQGYIYIAFPMFAQTPGPAINFQAFNAGVDQLATDAVTWGAGKLVKIITTGGILVANDVIHLHLVGEPA